MNDPAAQGTAQGAAQGTGHGTAQDGHGISTPESSCRDPAALARHVLRLVPAASLATLATADGWPFASRVLHATDLDGAPLLLLSNLAEHTRNLKRDPRVSLLLDAPPVQRDLLSGPRLTLLGEATPCTFPAQRLRFLNRHVEAADYAGFADFTLYRLRLERGHFIAGFGRIVWLAPADLLRPPETALAEAEALIVREINEERREALIRIATRLLGLGEGPWRLSGLDAEGLDLALEGRTARLDFEQAVSNPAMARAALAALARRAEELERL